MGQNNFIYQLLSFILNEIKTVTGLVNLITLSAIILNSVYLRKLFTFEGLCIFVVIVISAYLSDKVSRKR